MTDLTIHLTDTLRLLDPAGKPLAGLSRRGQALLAYLACQPGYRAERGYIADLLWSDRAQEQARASLRQELSVLRRALDDVVQADRQVVWLVPGRIDVQFGTGEFLRGFDLASEGFEDWLRTMRQSEPLVTSAVARPESERPAVAIMPFDEFGAPEADMFADGVVEEITGALSRVREFDVIARQSAFALRGTSLPVPDIADRLGAEYVVEGSVRRAGQRVRIAVQLVRGQDGHTLWSDRFDDRLDDLFDLQDRIAAKVAGQVSPNLRAAEIARAGTIMRDRTAYELTLTAYPHFWAHTREDNDRAIALFQEAVARDPGHVPAKAHLAWALSQKASYMWSDNPFQAHDEAYAVACAAEAMSVDHAPSLVALGASAALSSPDADKAHWLIDKALRLDPNNAWGWMRAGWNAFYRGDFATGFAAFDRAELLSPLDPFYFNVLLGRACCYRGMQQYDQAIDLIREAMLLKPQITWAYRMLVGILVLAGRDAEAETEAAKLRAHYPDITIRTMEQCIPRSARIDQMSYLDAFRRAGIPED